MASKTRRRGRTGKQLARRRRNKRRRWFKHRPHVQYPYTLPAQHPKPINWLVERISVHDQVCTDCTIALGQTAEREYVLARAEMLNTGKKDVRSVTLQVDEDDNITGAVINGVGELWVLDDTIPEVGWFSWGSSAGDGTF